MRRVAAGLGLALAVVAGSSGCSPGTTTVTVSAASSLTDAFADLEGAYEVDHPDVDVVVNVGSSGTLAEQLAAGAPADVFAAADEVAMARVVDDPGTAGPPVAFATTELVLVTQPGNPLGIASLADLADLDVVVAVCAPTAPCGRYAAGALAAAGVVLPTDVVTEGQNVRATLAAVVEGGAAAGLVYRTDALAAGDALAVVELPGQPVEARYPIAVLADAAEPDAAAGFVDLVTSDQGRAVLAAHGFGPP